MHAKISPKYGDGNTLGKIANEIIPIAAKSVPSRLTCADLFYQHI